MKAKGQQKQLLKNRKSKNNLQVIRLQVGSLQTNCFIAHDKKESIIIDPGDSAQLIYQKISELDLKPKYIIATHGHFDHILAVNELKAALKIPFLMNKGDNKLLLWMRKSTKYFTNFDPGPPPKVDKNIKEGDKVTIGNSSFLVLKTPGHTPGSVSLYSKGSGVVFVGDVIFKGGGVGRTDLPYSNKKDLEKSIKKLVKLPKETVVHSGHGEVTTIGKFVKLIQ